MGVIFDRIECKAYPNLFDYLGIDDNNQGNDKKLAVFESHYPLEALVTKIKKGELF